MEPHSSLTAPLGLPDPLDPQPAMARNDLCWCGSQKKWKKCHRDRHLQPKSHVGQLLDAVRKRKQRGSCLHPEASLKNCSGSAIKSHTVQRAGGLGAIAECGHVLSAKKAFDTMFKDGQFARDVTPGSVGLGEASTFMGFCSRHDNSLFAPIEKRSLRLDAQAAFLLSFRAVAYEYLAKRMEFDSIEIKRDLDKGLPFGRQVHIQQVLHLHACGLKRGMRDIASWKRKYDALFLSNDFDSTPYFAIEFPATLPFVCCGAFHPEVDFAARRLQDVSRGDSEFEHVSLNVSAFRSKSFVVFGWHGAPAGPAEQFVESFRSLSPSNWGNAALILAAEHCENLYFKPSWWNSLDDRKRSQLLHRMRSGAGDQTFRSDVVLSALESLLPEIEIADQIASSTAPEVNSTD